MTFIAFPFKQIGSLLRSLSLSGAAGNIVAILVYVAIGMMPILIYLYLKQRHWCQKADGFLFALSLLLFVVLYFMINPGLFPYMDIGGDVVLGGTFYSLLFSYLVIRLLSQFKQADMDELKKGLQVLLYALIFLFLLEILAHLFSVLPENIQAVKVGNTAISDSSLHMTYFFLGLQAIVHMIPYLMDIIITFFGAKALDEMLRDSYSDAAMAAVDVFAHWSVKSLGITVFSIMLFNLLQLLFWNSLYQVNVSVVIPLFSIAFALSALLLARYVQENQRLKQDNDLFI